MSAMQPRLTAPGNRLLASLPAEERERLAPHLEPVLLPERRVLYEPDQPLTHVYFPHGGAISLVTVLGDGSAVEVGMAGREGVAGVSALFGVTSASIRAIVQLPVEASMMRVASLRQHLRRGGPFQQVLHRYAHALFEQVMQFVACNRRHTLHQRCARWLLMTHDRAGADTFPLTQEFLSYMLGVHRPGVSKVVADLRRARHIDYRRGYVEVKDRAGLEGAACECYATIERRFRSVVVTGEAVMTEERG
jgi:CRP-like cAMP-binding protein